MKNLLESGVHFGHQTKRWDPRMKRFIFAERNGIHIIDLQKTINAIKDAYEVVRKSVLANKSILFVGTKKQAQQAIEREARRCNMYFVNNRWLGGMLTNFNTIKKSILRLKKIEKMEVDGTFASLTKKEVARLLKEKTKLEKNLGGIKEMKDLPGVVFVIDTKKEQNAVEEAKKMNIPIVAVVDTNCNPQGIDYPIPGNDDAIRAITLFTQIIANAVIEAENEAGLEVIESLQEESEEPAGEENPDAPRKDFDALVEKDIPEEVKPRTDDPVDVEYSEYMLKDDEPVAGETVSETSSDVEAKAEAEVEPEAEAKAEPEAEENASDTTQTE